MRPLYQQLTQLRWSCNTVYTPRHCRADNSEGRILKTSNKKQFKEQSKKAKLKRVKEVTVKSYNRKTYRKSTCLATKSHKSEILKIVKTFLRTSSRAYPFGHHSTWQSMKQIFRFQPWKFLSSRL